MTDLLIFMFICLFCQIAILRIWLNSELFSAIQDKLAYWRETKKGIIHYITYLLTCWQCLGVWVSCGVVFSMSWLLPAAPIKVDNIACLICIGLGISLVSELLEYYFLLDMDTVPTSIYDTDKKNDTVDAESVFNNEGDSNNE